jgi:hypothetical protein
VRGLPPVLEHAVNATRMAAHAAVIRMAFIATSP